MTKLKWKFFTALLRVLTRYAPELLDGYISQEVERKVNQVALGVTMAHMDRLGLSHCRLCPQRFGLRKHDGDYYCEKHKPAPAMVAA